MSLVQSLGGAAKAGPPPTVNGLLGSRRQTQDRADGFVPVGRTFGTATLGPAGQHNIGGNGIAQGQISLGRFNKRHCARLANRAVTASDAGDGHVIFSRGFGPHRVVQRRNLGLQQTLLVGGQAVPLVHIHRTKGEAPTDAQRVGVGRNLVPFGRVGRHGAGDGAIDDTFFKGRDHFGKRDRDGCTANAFDKITQGGGIDADLLAFEVRDTVYLAIAPQSLAGERIQHQKLGVIDIRKGGFQSGEIGVGHLALRVDVLGQRGQVRPLKDRVFSGDIARQAKGEVKHPVLDQTHDLEPFEAQARLGLDLADDLAIRRLVEARVKERLFVLLVVGQARPGADRVQDNGAVCECGPGCHRQSGECGCDFFHGCSPC
mmetsp:Transcript_4654/g.7363  ORF Transcript_4654/g.7363 Transcript_4654/m.7363 type:complete len:373 (+) Transcript_4654:519-1637(+)